MKKLWLAISVLRKGRELSNAAVWKTASAATAAIAVVLPDTLSLVCSLSGYCLDLTPSQINETAAGFANVGVGVFLLYTIFGTSKKVGL